LIRRLVIRCLILAVFVVTAAFLIEFSLEARDVAQYLPGQTFAKVGEAQIRYQLLGANHPGATVVFLAGISGSIEQTVQMQSAVSSEVPSLAYDRAGYGFSTGSTAHSAGEQADELAALLHALNIETPVVVVGYSDSNQLARVFAGRYPEKTAGVYLIDPYMPEFDATFGHDPRRIFMRPVIFALVSSSLGYTRLTQRMRSWRGPESLVEQRAEAILARRSHSWALAREWYARPVSARETREAPVPPALPIELIFPKPPPDYPSAAIEVKLFADLVARSSRGKLLECDYVDHSQLLISGPVFDRMVENIKDLSKAGASQ
jgi:pimeloyl-ACP methyl ester carboxylesterase